MALCQTYAQYWTNMNDVMHFAMSQSGTTRKNFLMALSAVCWCFWKTKNELVFKEDTVPTIN
jgi:hypothetical protein